MTDEQPEQQDYGVCEVPDCGQPVAGWHKLGVNVCEVHFMLSTEELDALLPAEPWTPPTDYRPSRPTIIERRLNGEVIVDAGNPKGRNH